MPETDQSPHIVQYGRTHQTGGQLRFSPLERFNYVKHTQDGRPLPFVIPYVTVKKRPDGKYVVIEKYPEKLKPVAPVTQDHSPWKLMKLKNSSEVKFRSIRPEWKYSLGAGVLSNTNPANQNLPECHIPWNAQAKIGSLENYNYQPGGGQKRIFSEKVAWNASSKIGSFDNIDYPVKHWSESDFTKQRNNVSVWKLKPKYGAAASMGMFDNIHYTPGGAMVVKPKTNYSHVKSKIGSLDAIDHTPEGGKKKIPHFKVQWNAKSRIGSLENISHNPAGGDVLFLQEKLKWNQRAKIGSLDNITYQPGGGRVKIPHHRTDWRAKPRVGSLANVHHTPRGGNYVIPSKRINWKAESKVNSLPGKLKPKVLLPVDPEDFMSYEYEMDSKLIGFLEVLECFQISRIFPNFSSHRAID